MSKTHRVTRIAIITGIAIPSMMPRVWVERPFGAGGGEDEDVGDCRVDSVVGEDNVVGDDNVVVVGADTKVNKVVESKVGIVVAGDNPD